MSIFDFLLNYDYRYKNLKKPFYPILTSLYHIFNKAKSIFIRLRENQKISKNIGFLIRDIYAILDRSINR